MLIGPAHTHRYRRFADALTGAHARLAEKRGWLVLRFSGLSPPILCQLAWRTVPLSAPLRVRIFRFFLSRQQCSSSATALPVLFRATIQNLESPAYDAGSEANSESCEFIPGPPCGNHVHDPAEAEGFIHISNGIQGTGDVCASESDWRNPVARVTITRVD